MSARDARNKAAAAEADAEHAIINLLRFHDAAAALVFANTRATVARLRRPAVGELGGGGTWLIAPLRPPVLSWLRARAGRGGSSAAACRSSARAR